MNIAQTIVLKTNGGDYIADYWRATADARASSHRQLVARVAEMWPELWGSSARGTLHPLNDERRDWRRWIKSLERLMLAVILNQK
jgi:hypothetical protein